MARNILKKKAKDKARFKKTALMEFLILAIASAFFFAVTFFLRKQAGSFVPVSTAYFIETSMQMILMVAVFFYFSQNGHKGISFNQPVKGYWYAALAGITVVIGVGLSYLALRIGFLSKYQAITSPAQIIFAGLIGMLFAGEDLSVKQIVGTCIAICGILLVVI